MNAAVLNVVEREGWRLTLPDAFHALPPVLGARLIERAILIAAGRGGPALRRSRHAMTHRVKLAAPATDGVIAFVKVIDPPRWIRRIDSAIRGSAASREFRILTELAEAGIATAPLLIIGEEIAGGRTMLATARIDGDPLPRFLRACGKRKGLARKRAVLRMLGAEIARLHLGRFIHGDLTPWNVFVAHGDPIRFVFIDHERTARPPRSWQKTRLRNFVQLCRFDGVGIGNADRLRIIGAYADSIGATDQRALARRIMRMLRTRKMRDAAAVSTIAPAAGNRGRRTG